MHTGYPNCWKMCVAFSNALWCRKIIEHRVSEQFAFVYCVEVQRFSASPRFLRFCNSRSAVYNDCICAVCNDCGYAICNDDSCAICNNFKYAIRSRKYLKLQFAALNYSFTFFIVAL